MSSLISRPALSPSALTQTLTDNEVGGFVGEVVSAAILSNFVERADPDRPKGAAPAASATASPREYAPSRFPPRGER